METAVRIASRIRRYRRVSASILAVACAGEPAAQDPPSKDKEPTGMGEPGTSTGDSGLPEVEGDVCLSAATVVSWRYEGSLFNAAADLAAADLDDLECAFDGPDVFVRFTTTTRADVSVRAQGSGFDPTVAILGRSCTTAFACAQGLPAVMLDVAAGTELLIALGAPADDPAVLAAAAPADLGFVVNIDERGIIVTGDSCGLAGQGRCESGSACVAQDSGESRCTVIAGDTCSTAVPIIAGPAPTIVTVDPQVPYDDAHHHSCAGARRIDLVLHVQWDAPGGTLAASTTAPGVALAVRGPGCAADQELACASASPQGASAQALVDGAGGAFVFVELPQEDLGSELGPFDVALVIEP